MGLRDVNRRTDEWARRHPILGGLGFLGVVWLGLLLLGVLVDWVMGPLPALLFAAAAAASWSFGNWVRQRRRTRQGPAAGTGMASDGARHGTGQP